MAEDTDNNSLKELVEENTEYATIYESSDGSRVAKIYAEPIRFKNKSGKLINIDTSIVESRKGLKKIYKPKSTKVNMQINQDIEENNAILINDGNYSISLSFIQDENAEETTTSNAKDESEEKISTFFTQEENIEKTTISSTQEDNAHNNIVSTTQDENVDHTTILKTKKQHQKQTTSKTNDKKTITKKNKEEIKTTINSQDYQQKDKTTQADNFLTKDGKKISKKKINKGAKKTTTVVKDKYTNKNSSLKYKNVVESSVEMNVTPLNNGVKEEIIFNSMPENEWFSYKIVLSNNLSAELDKNNEVQFIDTKTKEKAGCIPAPFMIDSSEELNESFDVNVELTKVNDVEYIYSMNPSKEYLTDSARQYPVTLDPTILVSNSNTNDTFVASKFPNTNYNSGSNMQYLRTGRDNPYYIRRSFIKFNIPTNISASSISSAYLRLKKSGGAIPKVTAYRVNGNWGSSSIVWNNMPGFSTTDSVSSISTSDGNNWFKMGVTTAVKNWRSGKYPNLGFLLRDTSESGTSQWTTFYSSDAPSPNKPELVINYNTTVAPTTNAKKAYYGYLHTAASTYFNGGGGMGIAVVATRKVNVSIEQHHNEYSNQQGIDDIKTLIGFARTQKLNIPEVLSTSINVSSVYINNYIIRDAAISNYYLKDGSFINSERTKKFSPYFRMYSGNYNIGTKATYVVKGGSPSIFNFTTKYSVKN